MNKTKKLCTMRVENLITPAELLKKHPISKNIAKHVIESRCCIENILSGQDRRLLVIIGPCSIHDLDSTIDYANRLKVLRDKYSSHLEIIMRTYFEKPRTVIGWKGLIFDPDLNGRCRVNHGLELARKLLLQINGLGIPTATEFLDISTVKFIVDLISWGAIGARTTESQIHREMASSLSCPVGFKNGTDGNILVAINAILASRASHVFLSPDKNGQITIYQTSGNLFSHIIMRGGKKPNFYEENIASACKILRQFNLPERLVIDFSHNNSQKKHRRQLDVCDNVCQQIRKGSNTIVGIMAESFLEEGKQKIVFGKPTLYGQSITDPCLGWKESKLLLEKLADAVDSRF